MRRFCLVLLGILLLSQGISAQSVLGGGFVSQLSVGSQSIDWEVGEWAEYDLSLLFILGKIRKEVYDDTGDALWLAEVTKLFGQTQVVETLNRKSDGKVLRKRVNGEEKEVSDSNYEIIEQRDENIKVPKYPEGIDCTYLKLRERDNGDIIEVWVNLREVPIGGLIKTVVSDDDAVVSIELKDFSFRNDS